MLSPQRVINVHLAWSAQRNNAASARSAARPARLQSGKKSVCDIVNVLAAEGRMVRQCDQAIRNRFGYRTAAPVSESPAFLDHFAVYHGCVYEPSPHRRHHRSTLLAVPQQDGKQMKVGLRSLPLPRKYDVFDGAGPCQE